MNDDDLIVRVVHGDAGAFGSLIDRHYAGCARYAYRMLGNAEDAEEAIQDSFMRAYRSLPTYRPTGLFRRWLFRILVNQCRTVSKRLRKERSMTVSATEAMLEGIADRDSAERAIDARDSLAYALRTLDPALREAFLLKHGEGLEYEEMTAITGAGTSALKMRVKRACDVMRPLLQRGES